MKKSIVFSFILFFILSLFTFEIKAQSNGIYISPPILELKTNDTFKITIGNNTLNTKNFRVSFSDLSRNQSEFIFSDLVQNESDKYVDISSEDFIVEPSSFFEVNGTYLKSSKTGLIGLIFSEKGQNNNISVKSELVSIIIDQNIDNTVINQTEQNLNLNNPTSFKIFNKNIYLTPEINLETVISNNSNRLLKPNGEIFIYLNNSRVDQISLTQEMPDYLESGESFKLNNKKNINLNFFSIFEEVEIKQIIELSGNQTSRSSVIFIINWLLLATIIVTTFIFLAFAYFILKKLKLNKHSQRTD